MTANCEQVLSSHTSRRLIVMEKVSEADADNAGAAAMTAEAEGIFQSSAEFRNHVSEPK